MGNRENLPIICFNVKFCKKDENDSSRKYSNKDDTISESSGLREDFL